MKKLLALSFAAAILSFTASAQTERSVDKKAKMERHRGKHGQDMIIKDLKLTAEQKVQLKALQLEMKAKREALKAQDNITVKEMRERQAALQAEQKAKMENLLTAEQKTTMAEMKQQLDERNQRKIKKTRK